MENKNINKSILGDSIRQSFAKLNPGIQVKNPVMLVVYVGAVLTTVLYMLSFTGIRDESRGYILTISLILWFTVLFANFAEAIAEGRGRAQADTLRKARKDVKAKKLKSKNNIENYTEVLSVELKKGDIVIVRAGEQIPMDGEVIDGAASVDESAITGESAPVIRESGGDRSAVTGGTTLVSDWLIITVTAEAGESFLDKMISMVEGASRKKTPNEIALQILLVKNPKKIEIFYQMGIDFVVCTVNMIMSTLDSSVFLRGMTSLVPIGEGHIRIIEVPIDRTSPVVNKKISEANLPNEVIIGCIFREAGSFIPHGETYIKEGDMLVLISSDKDEMIAIRELTGRSG